MATLSSKLNIAQPRVFVFGPAAANTFVSVAHGLETDRLDILLERQVNTDEWEILDPGNYVTVDSTQINEAGLAALGTDTIRLRASTEIGAFLALADSDRAGLVSTGAQTFAGNKTFTGATTFSGGASFGNDTISSYRKADVSGVWTFNANSNPTTDSVTLLIERIGNVVTISSPDASAVYVGDASASTSMEFSGTIPSWALISSGNILAPTFPIVNNGTDPGVGALVLSATSLFFRRRANLSLAWGNSGQQGLNRFTFSYVLN